MNDGLLLIEKKKNLFLNVNRDRTHAKKIIGIAILFVIYMYNYDSRVIFNHRYNCVPNLYYSRNNLNVVVKFYDRIIYIFIYL